jgi:hypothetical protein
MEIHAIHPTSPRSFSCAHYISRAQGGLGIEQNILTLCTKCHAKFDGADREEMRPVLRAHLKGCYEGWNEADLVYKKEGER